MPRAAGGLLGWRSRRHARRDEAIEALRAHAGLIITSASRVLGSIHDAEDVAQDIAERLLRSPPTDVRSWPAYLKTLAVNAAIDRLRRRRPTVDTESIADTATPEAEAVSAERAAALREAVAALSQRDATLFSLFYLADLSQAEIGRQLSMTENSVGVALHRVRRRLGDALRSRLQIEQETR